jgi:hypothetical protein
MNMFLFVPIAFTICVAVIVLFVSHTRTATEDVISKDCEKLGSFYIGDKVYKCELVK